MATGSENPFHKIGMNTSFKFPFFAKASLFIIGLYFFISMLSLGQDIIVPMIYAIITAILISPIVNFLVKKKVSRALAITPVLLLVFLIIGGLIALLSSQASHLNHAWPKLEAKFQDLMEQTVSWASGHFNVSTEKINSWIARAEAAFINDRSAAMGKTLTGMAGILSATVLTPVYIFMILFYQPHLLDFAHKIFGADNNGKVGEILTEIKKVVQGYIIGLFGEFVIIAILNSIGLLALRIDYAILLGVIGAVLNVIPIIGGIVCVALFIVIALLTKSPVYVLYVIGVYTLIQFIDDHYIFPKIVGSKVKLNVLISLIAVILGDALWGIPGMFLAIPLTAIVKLILDRIESLKTWGFLLGTTVVSSEKIKFKFTIKGFLNGLSSQKS